MPPLLCLDLFRSRDRLPRRTRLRPLQGRAVGRGHENGAFRSRASGVIFTLDTESGFREVVFITGSWGLGENIVQGKVDPDEFYVHKPTFRQGYRAVLSRSLGGKEARLVYARGHGAASTRNMKTRKSERERFC